jgi:N6-adenosine-specific RNA methylase IME4
MLVRAEPEILMSPHPFAGLRRGYYGGVAVDPASNFSSYTSIQSQNWNSRRDNARHYAVMSFEALAALPVRELAAPSGCHLFIWSSGPFLLQASRLIETWGLKYSTRAFTWLKTRRGWEAGDPLRESISASASLFAIKPNLSCSRAAATAADRIRTCVN